MWTAVSRIRSVVIALALAPSLGRAEVTPQPDTISTPEVVRPKPRLIAVRTAAAPDIDGALRDASWQQAQPITSFTQKFPREAQSPSEPTELRVLYDDRALYIAFDCVQTGVPVKGRLARRDRQVEADWVQVAINDGSNTYEFSVNAAGVLGDGVRFNDTDYSADWDGVWDAHVKRSDRGWSTEMRIPLRIFRHPEEIADWGFQARRYISSRQEIDEWAFIPRSVAGEVSHYGVLSGLSGVRRSNPLELLPYVSGGLDWASMIPGGAAVGELDYYGTAGLDLSWRIGHELTLDASFNPDFAQVEADKLVLNLTTYETFVPEKRPFFVRGMSMFQLPRMELFPTSQTLFYTRRIGAAPRTPVTPDGGDAEAAVPSTIYAAAKLIGPLGRGVSAGLVTAVTGRNDVAIRPPAGPSQEHLADPLALANVGRIKVSVGSGAKLGLLATALLRFEPEDSYPALTGPGGEAQQQCPDGSVVAAGARCFHDSYVAGLDGSWRSSSGTYVAAGQALVTSIQNGPDRTIPDGTVIGSGDASMAGRLYLAKEGGRWLGSVEMQAIGRRVDFNDLGYLQRQNLVRFLPYLAYRTLDPFWEIAEAEARVYAATRDNLDGVKLLRGYYGGGNVRFKNFWTLAADVYRYDTRFEDREIGDGTPLQRPSATGLDVSLSTDPRQPIAAALSSETLIYEKGGSFTLGGEVTYQPLPRLELQLLPQITFASGDPRLVAGSREPGGEPLLFGDLRARALGGTLRSSYTFTNRLTLQLYTQLLLVAEHYSNFRTYTETGEAHPVIRFTDLMPAGPPASNPDHAETNLNLSAVLRWEYRPGSTLFLVYSRSQSPEVPLDGAARLDVTALRHGPTADALRLKLSYYWN
jgi:hypothetical protein